jgi:hypothetical protein
MAYTPHANRATNVPVTVFVGNEKHTVKVNEREKPPLERGFISLGKHSFKAGDKAMVEISNEGTDGFVVVDAVWVVEAEAK